MADRVLRASASMLNLLGVSQESSEYVQNQMATLLGLSDEHKMAQVAKLWQEAHQCKLVVERGERDIFTHEAKMNGIKYTGDERRLQEEKQVLQRTKDVHKINIERYHKAVKEAQRVQDEAADQRF